MHQVEILIGMLAVVMVLVAVARRGGVPYAPVLVTGGLVLTFIPGLPVVRLNPDVALLGFIPPLVYAASFRAASFDLRSEAPHILTLSTGLVLLTVAVVACVGRVAVGLPWSAAVVLGALAAPTDPVSASSVIRSVGAPERILAILEGESLINDGTGLAVFQVAVASAAGGVSLTSGVLRFVGISLGGCAIGAVVGWLLVQLRRRVNDPSLEIAAGLLAAFGSYVAASAAGASGVLAAVTAGLYSGLRAQDIASADTRLQIEPFWDALTFLAESVLFLLIGLQLPTIVGGLPGGVSGSAIADGVALVVAVFAARCLWMAVLTIPGMPRALPGRELAVLAAGGMRGALSLAGALSIPLLAGHHPFPDRDRVIFLVYLIVIGTLVAPSLGLERIVRRLGLAQGAHQQRQEVQARLRIVDAALARLDDLEEADPNSAASVQRLRGLLELRLTRLRARERAWQDDTPRDHDPADAAIAGMRREIIRTEREALADLRRSRRMPVEVLLRIQRDIDLDEARLHGAPTTPL